LIDLVEPPLLPFTPTVTTVSPPKPKPALMIGLTSAAFDIAGTQAAITKTRAVKDSSALLPVILCSPFWLGGRDPNKKTASH
jgi:hypothetical protein